MRLNVFVVLWLFGAALTGCCTGGLADADRDVPLKFLPVKETFTAIILKQLANNRESPSNTHTTSSENQESITDTADSLASELVRSLADLVTGHSVFSIEGLDKDFYLVRGISHGGDATENTDIYEKVSTSPGRRLLLEEKTVGRRLHENDLIVIESFWVNLGLMLLCVTCAGLAAGLTMGLVSIEPLEMAIKQRSGTEEEKIYAARILPLVRSHHFLLVTLLIFNCLAFEALPIVLGNLVPDWLAVILSVSLVLFFGEILPSAIFTGKDQLAIAAGMSWLVYLLMIVFFPVAWPISWILDRVLGVEGFKRYNRAEIAALVEVQQELSTVADDEIEGRKMHPDVACIVNGVLHTAEKSVQEAMVPMDKVFRLSMDEKLSANTMADIMAAGYSRVLIYEGSDSRNIRGYLQVKKLIILNPDDERDIASLMLRIPVVVAPSNSLLELLNTFQTGHSHIALVSTSPGITLESLKHGVRLEGVARPVGIITLEDIIEEIIQEEIMDESDRLNQFIENRAKQTLLRFMLKRQDERRFLDRHSTIALHTPASSTRSMSFMRQLPSVSFSGGPPSPCDDALLVENGQADVRCAQLTPISLGPAPAGRRVDEFTSLIRAGPKSQANGQGATGRSSIRGNARIAGALIAVAGQAAESSGSISSESGSTSAPFSKHGSFWSINDSDAVDDNDNGYGNGNSNGYGNGKGNGYGNGYDNAYYDDGEV